VRLVFGPRESLVEIPGSQKLAWPSGAGK